jgi:predicted DNA binding protein
VAIYPTQTSLWRYTLEVEHPGEWTEYTRGSTLFVEELFSECYPHVDRLIEFFAAISSRKMDLHRLMRVIQNRASDKIIAVQLNSRFTSRDFCVFGIEGDYHPSIRRTIEQSEGMSPYLSVSNGTETWRFFSMNDSIQEIVEGLPNGCRARVTRSQPASSYGPRQPSAMRERQMTLLRKALENGYFDYPRKASLTGLASQVGISKSSLSQSIRSALKEAVTRFVTE